jgi:hypothetical protein
MQRPARENKSNRGKTYFRRPCIARIIGGGTKHAEIQLREAVHERDLGPLVGRRDELVGSWGLRCFGEAETPSDPFAAMLVPCVLAVKMVIYLLFHFTNRFTLGGGGGSAGFVSQ